MKSRQHLYDYLVIVDFEATCEANEIKFLNEIIQFPAVLVDTASMTIVDEFCQFCKPTINSNLSPFCSQLTGISQETVDQALPFTEALANFELWLEYHGLGTKTFAIVTDGSQDMGHFLISQCQISGIQYPSYGFKWINLRKSFTSFYDIKWINLRVMCDIIGQPFEGRPHDGLDDSKNIARIVIRLLRDGSQLFENEKIVLGADAQAKNAAIQAKKFSHRQYNLATVAPIRNNAHIRQFIYNPMTGCWLLVIPPKVNRKTHQNYYKNQSKNHSQKAQKNEAVGNNTCNERKNSLEDIENVPPVSDTESTDTDEKIDDGAMTYAKVVSFNI